MNNEQDIIKNLREDFKEFSYIVSHDFLASLRHIKYFSNILLNKYEEKCTLSLEEQEYKGYLYRSIDKLEKMTASLKKYSRFSMNDVAVDTIKSADIISLILQNLPEADKERVVVKDTPNVKINPDNFRVLMAEIISNALKYSAPPFVPTQNDSVLPDVVIRSEEGDDGIFITVEDFGLGVPDDNKQEVFKIFRQLHPDQEENTIGTGLAFAKKIVEHQGGKIWIEDNKNIGPSKKEEGSIIKIFLPH